MESYVRRTPGGGQSSTEHITDRKIGDKLLDRYEIFDIRPGGLGVVFLVSDVETGQAYAVKTFQRDLVASNKEWLLRFEREADTWIRLWQHPHIVSLWFVQNIDYHPHLFLEYIDGGDLREWLRRGNVSLERSIQFSLEVCLAMEYACTKVRGMAHRDIKPANILITRDGHAKLTDFGLIKAFDDLPEFDSAIDFHDMPTAQSLLFSTLPGKVAGTPLYMAPEQFEDFRNADICSDVYSMGVVLYQMLTGRLPFKGRSLQELKEKVLSSEPPPPPRTYNASIPLDLERVVMKCLAKNPRGRFTDFIELQQALEPLYRSRGHQAPSVPKLEENDPHVLQTKGLSLSRLGKDIEALSYYDRALGLDPKFADAWCSKAISLAKLSRNEESIESFDRALRYQPQFPFALYQKGLLLEGLGHFEEGIECYKKVINLDPTYKSATKGLERCKQALLEPPNARFIEARVGEEESIRIIQLACDKHGTVDAARFRKVIEETIRQKPEQIIVDLSEAEYTGSYVLGELVRTRQVVAKADIRFAVQSIDPDKLEVLKLCKLDKILDVLETPYPVTDAATEQAASAHPSASLPEGGPTTALHLEKQENTATIDIYVLFDEAGEIRPRNLTKLDQILSSLVNERIQLIVIDMNHREPTTEAVSTLLTVLVRHHLACAGYGGTLKLAKPHPRLLNLLVMANMNHVFEISVGAIEESDEAGVTANALAVIRDELTSISGSIQSEEVGGVILRAIRRIARRRKRQRQRALEKVTCDRISSDTAIIKIHAALDSEQVKELDKLLRELASEAITLLILDLNHESLPSSFFEALANYLRATENQGKVKLQHVPQNVLEYMEQRRLNQVFSVLSQTFDFE